MTTVRILLGTLATLVVGGLALPTTATAEVIGTLTLDALSYVSFQDEEILAFPSGSTLRFHFDDSNPDGTVSFTLAPSDVSIGPIPLSSGTLQYGLASPAKGTMRPTAEGRRRTWPRRTGLSKPARDRRSS